MRPMYGGCVLSDHGLLFTANDLWQELPYKYLNQFAFPKSVMNYILSQQYQT